MLFFVKIQIRFQILIYGNFYPMCPIVPDVVL